MKSVILICMLAAATVAQGEPLDRIAVTVGNYVITESALVQDLKVGAFLDQKPVDLSPAAKRRSAERLADMALILREADNSHLPLPTVEQAKATLDLLRKQYRSEAEYQAALKSYGVTEAEVLAQLHTGMIAEAFSDLRFRPVVSVSDEDLRKLYEQVRDGTTFEESRQQIEDMLTRQRILDALDAWLTMEREDVNVRFHQQAFQ